MLARAAEGNAAFLAIYPAILNHAAFAFRGVRDPATYDDRVQETLAICWLWCCRLCDKGKDPREFPTTLAGFATRQVKCGRSFVGKKTYRNDALSPHAQNLRGFRTVGLAAMDAEAHAQDAPRWAAALADNTVSPVPVQAAFRIDFHAWLSSLTPRKRLVAEELAAGEATQDLAARHRLSPGRISQMRRELHADWHAFTSSRA